MKNLGKAAIDKVTGFKGIIVCKLHCLFGCAQYGISPKVKKDGDRQETHYFDEGRIKITGPGVSAKSVKAKDPGADVNPDAPTR